MAARILLIEDNATNLELMVYLLRAHGYEPLTAEDGEAGIEAALRERPDLIVCDIQLPKLDGFEVVRRLNGSPQFSRVPLVAVTALVMVGDRDRLLNAGFGGYLAKPIVPERFVGQIEDFLGPELRAPARPPAVWREAPDEPRPTVASRGTVLVVDDTDANRMLLCSLLEPCGFTVVTASGLGPALTEIQRVLPDLILSDVHLRDGNALDLVRLLRSDERWRSIPVLLQSASSRDVEREMLVRELGKIKLLGRPMEARELLAEIETVLAEVKK